MVQTHKDFLCDNYKKFSHGFHTFNVPTANNPPKRITNKLEVSPPTTIKMNPAPTAIVNKILIALLKTLKDFRTPSAAVLMTWLVC